jgi:GMP synthase (glutamine-hydrolysing)
MAILILQHHDIGSPTRLAATLRDHGFALDFRRPDLASQAGNRTGIGSNPDSRQPQGVPRDLDNVHALLIMGGPQNVTDIERYPWMQQEVALIQQAHARELPIIGICLGAQLIGHALGGKVTPREKPAVGFYPVSVTIPGQTETMMAGIPWNHQQLFSCGQEVSTLPAGATLLMTSKHAKHAAFKVGLRTYAFQFHFECDRPQLDALMQSSKDDLALANLTEQEVRVQADQHYAHYARISDRLALNLTTYAFPFTRKLSA